MIGGRCVGEFSDVRLTDDDAPSSLQELEGVEI